MSGENRSDTEQQFDILFQHITEQKACVPKLHDDDLLLICCLMAEIVKILQASQGDG